MYESRLQHLREMHQTLDREIDGLESTGRFTDARLMELKRQRLLLRDQIQDLEQRQAGDNENE
jgi:hypothetical protein